MSGTTAKYGLPYPTSTDLVKDGATAIEALADDVDDLLGMNLVSDTTFTTVNTVNIDNCFSATYRNYRIVFTLTAQSNSELIYMRYRNSGGNNTTNQYDSGGMESQTGSATLTAIGGMAQNKQRVMFSYNSPGFTTFTMDVMNPQVSTRTSHVSTAWSANSTTAVLTDELRGFFRGTDSFTGISFGLYDAGAQTMTGKVSVYGYAK